MSRSNPRQPRVTTHPQSPTGAAAPAVFIVVGIITGTAATVWIPARMEISPTWMRINYIWTRGEKICLLLLDGALNFYFLYLIRRNLIDYGLDKYQPLYWFNIAMIVLELTLDEPFLRGFPRPFPSILRPAVSFAVPA